MHLWSLSPTVHYCVIWWQLCYSISIRGPLLSGMWCEFSIQHAVCVDNCVICVSSICHNDGSEVVHWRYLDCTIIATRIRQWFQRDLDIYRESWWHIYWNYMMTSSNGNISVLLAPCEGNSPVRWIPLTKASDAELWCFLWSAPEQMG